jgi:hypothetical protein
LRLSAVKYQIYNNPKFPLPLRGGDAEAIVDLQGLLNGVYDRAAYDLRIDYTAAPLAALSET